MQFERSIHVPEDELCFFVFEARTGGEAALAAEQAGLEPFRVVEAISSGPEDERVGSVSNDRRGGGR